MTSYEKNIKVLTGTVVAIDSRPLAAVKASKGVKARPARTMGIVGLVDELGVYVEATDFGSAWESLALDGRARLIVDKQVRGERTYFNIVRAMDLAGKEVPA